MSIYKTGRIVFGVSFIGLMLSGVLLNLALCLKFSVMLGVGLTMWVLGD